MIVCEKSRYHNHIYDVYVMYWVEEVGRWHYYGYDVKFKEFRALDENECITLDNEIGINFLLIKDSVGYKLMHKALYEDDLYVDVIEHDPDAMKEFEKRRTYMKSHFDACQNPYVDTVAEIIGEGYWVSCPICLNAIEVDPNQGVITCTKSTCKSKLNNPFAKKLPVCPISPSQTITPSKND